MLRNSPSRSGRNGEKRKLHNEIKNLNTEMICSSVNGDSQEKAWLEFYSGDQFLGSTDPIDINSGKTIYY